MGVRFRQITFVASVVAIALLGFMSGCSRAQPKSPEPAPVDPRFATSEALLTYFNSLNTQLPPNLPEIRALYYAENEYQRKQLLILQQPANDQDYRLTKAMYDQFGESLADYTKYPHLKPRKCTLAKIERTLDRRVEGSFKNSRGKTWPLQLVQIGYRWWVSGYTLEFQVKEADRELHEKFADEVLALNQKEDLSYLDELTNDIRAGKYKTAAEARKAFGAAVREHIQIILPDEESDDESDDEG